MGKSDFTKCREIRHQMSRSTQCNPLTQYLLYKVALRCHDVDSGRLRICFSVLKLSFDQLPSVSTELPRHPRLTLLCCMRVSWTLKRMETGFKSSVRWIAYTVESTMLLLQVFTCLLCFGVQHKTCGDQIVVLTTPSLIARLLVEELENQQSQDPECINELCKVFEGGGLKGPRPG